MDLARCESLAKCSGITMDGSYSTVTNMDGTNDLLITVNATFDEPVVTRTIGHAAAFTIDVMDGTA